MSDPINNARGSKPLAPAWLVIGLLVAAAIILSLEVSGTGDQPGFLGTFAPLIADVNLLAQIGLLVILILGLIAIKRKNTARHRTLQTTLILFSIVLTVLVMVGRFFVIFSSGSDWLIVLHGILGLSAIVMGTYLVLHMNDRVPPRWRTKKWKLMMRVTWLLFFTVSLVGLTVYWRLYIP